MFPKRKYSGGALTLLLLSCWQQQSDAFSFTAQRATTNRPLTTTKTTTSSVLAAEGFGASTVEERPTKEDNTAIVKETE